uniref:Uncharacterized protein n=1 Tax=Arundo donax TaxID=35708 RepID=A0A0A9A0N3_ARUDO
MNPRPNHHYLIFLLPPLPKAQEPLSGSPHFST